MHVFGIELLASTRKSFRLIPTMPEAATLSTASENGDRRLSDTGSQMHAGTAAKLPRWKNSLAFRFIVDALPFHGRALKWYRRGRRLFVCFASKPTNPRRNKRRRTTRFPDIFSYVFFFLN
jgi:hypothetical protein